MLGTGLDKHREAERGKKLVAIDCDFFGDRRGMFAQVGVGYMLGCRTGPWRIRDTRIKHHKSGGCKAGVEGTLFAKACVFWNNPFSNPALQLVDVIRGGGFWRWKTEERGGKVYADNCIVNVWYGFEWNRPERIHYGGYDVLQV